MKGDVRQLNEVKLYEVSLTAFPANEQAVVTSVKAQSDAAAVARFCQVIAESRKQLCGR